MQTSFGKVQSRPYQNRIITRAFQMLTGSYRNRHGKVEDAVQSLMIESPTGSGKTVMALCLARLLQEHYPDLVICWIAMRRNLLAQAQRENIEKEIGVENIHYISMFDRNPEAILAARAAGKRILMIVDESQHDAASSMADHHNTIRPDMVLGMTATPFRTDRLKLCFQQVIKDAGIHALIQDGYLSEYDHYTIENWTPQNVAKHYSSDPGRWGKSIFYFNNVSLCHQLQSLLLDQGHVSEVVTASSDWEDQVARFKTGEVQLLINCMKLTEGFDEPSIQTAWVRDSGRGPTIQMSGRAFRLHADLPVKQIVQSTGTRWPMMRTATPRFQYLYKGDHYASLKLNQSIDQITHTTMRMMATSTVNIPKFLTERQKKSNRREAQD